MKGYCVAYVYHVTKKTTLSMKHFKNGMLLPCSILFITVLFAACGRPEAQETKTETPASLVSTPDVAGDTYVVDKKESVVKWLAGMKFNTNSHYGYVYVSTGEFVVDKDQIVSGTITIDMNTIEDEKHGRKNNLIDHLKSADFFDVEKFPTSSFVVSKVAKAGKEKNVYGKLTIKGISQVVSFPAKIEVKDGVVNATGKLVIDRTKFDVRYGSEKFFSNLADETMKDEVEFEVKIVARKK
jgi:polyisoprenoid-binding protein YceI